MRISTNIQLYLVSKIVNGDEFVVPNAQNKGTIKLVCYDLVHIAELCDKFAGLTVDGKELGLGGAGFFYGGECHIVLNCLKWQSCIIVHILIYSALCELEQHTLHIYTVKCAAAVTADPKYWCLFSHILIVLTILWSFVGEGRIEKYLYGRMESFRYACRFTPSLWYNLGGLFITLQLYLAMNSVYIVLSHKSTRN